MKQPTTRLFGRSPKSAVLTMALASACAFAQSGANSIAVPPVPDNLKVEAGHSVYLKGHAEGTQNYICLPTTSGFAWTFLSPQATLFYKFKWFGTEVSQQITTHFLSPNPDEGGTPRPTWQSSIDTSSIWARLHPGGSSSDSNYVEAGAIPWLLLDVVGKRAGPTHGNILTRTTFIQRLNTSGGIAPSSGCSTSANIGATALVPYSTDYFFYKRD